MKNKVFGGVMALCIGVYLYRLRGSLTVWHVLLPLASLLLFLPKAKNGNGKPVCIVFLVLWVLTLGLDGKLIFDRCFLGYVPGEVANAEFYALCGGLPVTELVYTPGKGVLTVLLLFLRRLTFGKALNVAAVIVNALLLKSAQLLLFLTVYRRHADEPLTLVRFGAVSLLILQPEAWLTNISCESVAVSLVCFAMYLAERNSERDDIAAGVLTGLAAALRGMALFALPGLIKKHGKRAAVIALAAMLLFLMMPGVLMFFVSGNSLYFTSELLPPTHYLMAGLGDLDEQTEIGITASVPGFGNRVKINLDESAERIKRMGPAGLLRHLAENKVFRMWDSDICWTGEQLQNLGIFKEHRRAAVLDGILWPVLLTGLCVSGFRGKGGLLTGATAFALIWSMTGAFMLMLVPYILLTVSGDA